MTTEPNKLLLSDERIPTVTLGGVKWPIQKLAPRQLQVVLPLIGKCMPAVKNLQDVSSELFHDLATVVYMGLSRGHKELTREDFDEMDMDLPDVTAAFFVVANQTYALKPAPKKETNGVTEGEASGALQTGTA